MKLLERGERPAEAEVAPTDGAEVRTDEVAIDPRMAQRRLDVVRQTVRRRTRIAGVVLAAGTLVVMALAVVHSSLFGIHDVTVTGTSDAEGRVLAAAGLAPGEPLVDVSESAASRRLERLPWVASASVVRSWPRTVHIALLSRVAVAQVPLDGARSGPFAEVDVTGRVLAWRPAPVAGLPWLVGVGRPGAAGTWLADSAGPSADGALGAALPGLLATPAGPTAAALAWVADLRLAEERIGPNRAGVRITRVTVTPAGTLEAMVRPGGVVLDLGAPTDLAAKVAAVAAFVRVVPLDGLAAVDFAVPDRPTATQSAGG